MLVRDFTFPLWKTTSQYHIYLFVSVHYVAQISHDCLSELTIQLWLALNSQSFQIQCLDCSMYKLTLPQWVLIIYTDAFKSQKEGFTSPEAEVTGGCEVPIIDVGNQTS